MKNLVVLLFAIIALIFSLQSFNLFKTTRTGDIQQSYTTLTSIDLPPIFASYLSSRNIRFELYKIPNYIKDFLSMNSEFSIVYRSKPKYTVIIFAPINESDKDYISFQLFYEKLKKTIHNYPKNFNIIFRYENYDDVIYKNTYDNAAFKDLMQHCKHFCFIDPSKDTMFVFKKLTMSEINALEALFQQYDSLLE